MKEVVKQVKGLTLGDLVKVDWYDASIGKGLSGGLNGIDVPVTSWGIYIGVLGQKSKHIILAQNNLKRGDALCRAIVYSYPSTITFGRSRVWKGDFKRLQTERVQFTIFLIQIQTVLKRIYFSLKVCL
jgi:hypothetical protein